MPFKVETLPEQLISGFQTTLPTPASFNDISEMSIVKADYISKLKDIQDQVTEDAMDDDFYYVNFNQDEKQHYLVGVRVMTAPTESFTIPAGKYAKFEFKSLDRNEIDQMIGAAYGELAQSTDYAVAGNYNLEVVTNLISGKGKFKIYLPIVAK